MEINITKEINEKFVKEYDQLDLNFNLTRFFLLGKNKNAIVEAIPLARNFSIGCHFLPGITHKEISDAYLKITKQKLEIAGFARITNYGEPNKNGERFLTCTPLSLMQRYPSLIFLGLDHRKELRGWKHLTPVDYRKVEFVKINLI
jgi:hypothetical protein